MKRLLLVITLFFALSSPILAAHIIGGEMRYAYVSPGTAPNSKIYRITLILFKGDDPFGAPLAGSYVVGVFNNDNNQKFPGTAINNNWLVTQDNPPGILAVPIVFPACIQSPPTLDYEYASYSFQIELPNNLTGYTIAYQTCCRINGMVNVGNSTGSTYMCSIPGTNQMGTETDDSPQFALPVNVICRNAPFTLSFASTDPNTGDSLAYRFCDAFNGGAATNAGFSDPAAPPYGFVNYTPPYSGGNPFGTGASINVNTGIITGTAPDFGKYVVSVCVDVYRRGIRITTHRKDLIVQVSDCAVTTANPMPSFVTCDGFNIQFSHNSTGANTVFWDFGDGSTLADTSLLSNPSYTYTDTGIYLVKFVINRGTSCSDSTTRSIGVYPGFFPAFEINGSCFTNPYTFTDLTNTNYGVVNSWRWNFGDMSTLADTSRIQNPQWTYPSPGTRTARLIVTNSKGCVDTAFVNVDVLDRPPLSVDFADTLICIPDAVQLSAIGSGNFTWTPNTSISNPNTPNPTVNPTSNTWYFVTLNDNGCTNRDSVHVRVVPGVDVAMMPDTTICLTDTVRLTAITNGLSYTWSPGATLDNPNILSPLATPTAASTTYQLISRIGSCSTTEDVTIATVPYPVADAGEGPVLCYNTSGQLNGNHNGDSAFWTPTNYLSDPTILNPIVTPPRTTTYILTSYDDAGCPKPGRDTVIVIVRPRIHAFAGNDTIVVVGQPLHFQGSGGVSYQWIPSNYLDNPHIPDPIGIFPSDLDSIRYKLIVSDSVGCLDSAFVNVRIWKTVPNVFVPTAFTPNGDGLNDVIRPIAIGIQKINYFNIYNRWGQLLFTTTVNRHGWDGRVAGRVQNSGVFVWMVSAIDYTGRPIFLKGTVTLIR